MEIVEIKPGMVKLRRPTTEIHITTRQKQATIIRFSQDELGRVYLTVET